MKYPKSASKSPTAFIRYIFTKTEKESYEKNVPFELTLDEWCDIYAGQRGDCAISGMEMTYTFDNKHPSVVHDRDFLVKWPSNISPNLIDKTRGYVQGNVRFVCKAVSCMNMYVPTEWIVRFAEAIAKPHLKYVESAQLAFCSVHQIRDSKETIRKSLLEVVDHVVPDPIESVWRGEVISRGDLKRYLGFVAEDTPYESYDPESLTYYRIDDIYAIPCAKVL